MRDYIDREIDKIFSKGKHNKKPSNNTSIKTDNIKVNINHHLPHICIVAIVAISLFLILVFFSNK